MQPGAALAPAAELAGRIAGLQAGLAALGLDAALLQQNADLFYFAGTVQQSYLYVPVAGEATLFVRKVAERARRESALGAIVELPSPKDLPRLIAERYGALPARLGLELDVLPVTDFRRLEKLLPGAAFEDVGRTIVRQRAVKSAWEVERIRASAAVADAVSRLIPGLLEEGLTEVEFAGRVEAEARRLGHEGYIRMRGFNQEMFYGQLLAGPSGCVSSYLDTPLAGTGLSPSVAQGASFRRIGRGEPVVFDFVPVRDGYMADFTRMYSLGPLDAELLRAYDAALQRAGGGDGRGPSRRDLSRRVGGRAGGRRRGRPGRQLHGARRRPGAVRGPRHRHRARRAAGAHRQRARARAGHGLRARAQVRAPRRPARSASRTRGWSRTTASSASRWRSQEIAVVD